MKNYYVWIWLPGHPDPVLCGHIGWDGNAGSFAYVRSYHHRRDPMGLHPLWPQEWELGIHTPIGVRHYPAEDDALPGVIADVAPGRWGEYVLEKIHGRRLSAIEALLAGSRDRTGALEFSRNPGELPDHEVSKGSLDDIAEAVALLDSGRPIDPYRALIIRHGPSLGGRRPKATVLHQGQSWVAKFVSVRDLDQQQPRREAFGLALARAAGISVPEFQLVEVHGKPVLLVERFDRGEGSTRRHVVSARSLQNLSERQLLNSASYLEIAQLLRRWSDSDEAALQWFDRMVFNVVLGNTDDHALNHLFGWNGRQLSLMPAFDLEQQPDAGDLQTQEMIIGLEGKRSSLSNALSGCAEFGLRRGAAVERIRKLVAACRDAAPGLVRDVGLDPAAGDEMFRTLKLDDRGLA